MKQLLTLLCVSLLFLSCASFGTSVDEISISATDPDALSRPCRIEGVSVEYDRYRDEGLAAQVREMLGIKVRNAGFSGDERANQLFLEISQRSFIKGITVQNAIYATLLMTDPSGKEVLRISRYLNTSDSILSPVTQSAILDSLVNQMRKAR